MLTPSKPVFNPIVGVLDLSWNLIGAEGAACLGREWQGNATFALIHAPFKLTYAILSHRAIAMQERNWSCRVAG